MGLAEIFAPIGVALADELGGFTKFVGPEGKDNNAAPPWIAWVPVGSRLIDPKQARGDAAGADPIFTRQWAIDVEIWGKTLADTEILVDRFLAETWTALSKHGLGSQPPEETWNPGGVTARGVQCILRLFVSRPVLRTPPRLVSPTTIQTATEIEGSVEQINVTVIDP